MLQRLLPSFLTLKKKPANLTHLSIRLTMNEHGMQPGSAVFLTGTLATKRS